LKCVLRRCESAKISRETTCSRFISRRLVPLRWHNHLNPRIKKESWTFEEDTIIIDMHKKIGSRWSEIAKMLTGR
jgi:hypothetical protein